MDAERKRECAAVWSQEFGAGWSILSQYPHPNYQPSTGTVLQLLNSPLNPLHCSAVKSTPSPADYSPPIAAFITKFMMKQFCVLFLQWSRYQGQTCSKGTEYTRYVCMNTTVRTCSFTPVVFIYKSLMGWGRMMIMRLDADKERPPNHLKKSSSTFYNNHNLFTYLKSL